MGRAEGSEIVQKYCSLDYGRAVQRLREIGKLSNFANGIDYACEIVPLLHSKVSFDVETEIIDTGKWNAKIALDNSLSGQERLWWTFPMDLKLSSPSFKAILDSIEAAGLREVRLDPILGKYAAKFNGCVLEEFYRLFSCQSPEA
jgi:hypothetical protein